MAYLDHYRLDRPRMLFLMACRNVRQVNVAAAMKVSAGYFSNWIHGRRPISGIHLRQLAALLAVAEHDLLPVQAPPQFSRGSPS